MVAVKVVESPSMKNAHPLREVVTGNEISMYQVYKVCMFLFMCEADLWCKNITGISIGGDVDRICQGSYMLMMLWP